MQEITEEKIAAMAPNQAAAANGKKISRGGGFVRLEHSADDTFYMGECKGSGKSNYITSVDFIEPDAPVCRCSCPSRQFPCKHGLALLYEIAAKREFGTCAIPDDIIKKREKKQSRDKKEADIASSAGEADADSKMSIAASCFSIYAYQELKKQLEGIELAAQMVKNILKSGLATMGAGGVKTYEQLSKQLGDYYLSGMQHLVNELIIEMKAFDVDGKDEHYDAAAVKLERLWTLIKKSREYLTAKLESDDTQLDDTQLDDTQLDDTQLYEQLGGVWKLEELKALGLCRSNAELLQLSFDVSYDDAGKQYIDEGCYIDLGSGELVCTYNYRPVKALKYIRQDDSVFHVTQVGELAMYPGQGNKRVRWNGSTTRAVTKEDIDKVRSFAADYLSDEVKKAKNILKNALAPEIYYTLIRYERIGECGERLALLDKTGASIMLGDAPGKEKTTDMIRLLPDTSLLEDKVLSGGFFYDRTENRIKLMVLSILTDNEIVRIAY